MARILSRGAQTPSVNAEGGVEVLPCTFCLSTNLEMMSYPATDMFGHKALIHCKDCNGSGPTVSVTDLNLQQKDAVVEAWNKASRESERSAEIDYLRAEVSSLRQQLATAAQDFKEAMEILMGPERSEP